MFHPDTPRVSVAVLILAAALGVSILLFPYYVPILFLGFLILGVSLVEKPPVILFPIAFIAMQNNLMLSKIHGQARDFVLDHNHLLVLDFFSLAALIVIAVGRVTGKIRPLRRHSFDLPLVLLAIYAAISLLWAKDSSGGIFLLLHLLSCMALFYAPIILLTEKKTAQIFLWIWLMVAVYLAVLSISTLYVKYAPGIIYKTSWYLDDYNHSVSFYAFVFDNIRQRGGGVADPNRVALYLNSAFFTGLALILNAKRLCIRILIGTVMFFLLYTIMHTLSKGGLGSLLIAVTSYAAIHKRFSGKFIRTMLVFLAAMALSLAIMSYIDLGGGLGRFGQSPAMTSGKMSLALRFTWWQSDLKLLFATGGLGGGIGGISGFDWSYAQSVYFSLLADLGLPGVLLASYFAFSFGREFYLLMKNIYSDNYFFTLGLMGASCVLVFLIHALVDFAYNLRLPWLMAGLAFAAAEIGNNELKPLEERC